MAEDANAAALRPGYRGKCLYKTGKCMNERALKTSGQPHNLCEEHRNRQNQHQRKLDAKNRFNRKEKRAKTEHLALGAAIPGTGTPNGNAAATDPSRLRYAPYQKARVSPTGASAAMPDDPSAVLAATTANMLPTSMPMHGMPYQSMSMTSTPQLLPGAPNVVPEMMASGWVVLPNGPQPPQMPYSAPMQDFDGIVVPIPSTLEGQERVEFRARVYQKVMDFIAEEYGRRSSVSTVTDDGKAATTGIMPGLVPTVSPHVDEGTPAVVEPTADTSNVTEDMNEAERRPNDVEDKPDDVEMDAKQDATESASPNETDDEMPPEQVAHKKTRGRPRKTMV